MSMEPAGASESENFPQRPHRAVIGTCLVLLVGVLCVWVVDRVKNKESRNIAAWREALHSPVDRTSPLDSNKTRLVLLRGACLGFCPEYRVEISDDGSVEFLGRRNVCEFGQHSKMIDPYAVRHLVRAMLAADFFRVSSRETFAIDIEDAAISLDLNGRTRGIRFQRFNTLLDEMAAEIDRLSGTKTWLPVNSSEGGYCPEPGGFRREVPIAPE